MSLVAFVCAQRSQRQSNIPSPETIVHTASSFGTGATGEAVHFSRVRDRHAGVARVE